MRERPVLTGPIPQGGVLGLLRQIEELRTTGVLRFRGGSRRGEVHLVRGELANDQPPIATREDPVEVLLSLRSGTYELLQQLPALAVSHGDGSRRNGSLAVHVPADLMRYCEQAGLTGTLRLVNGNRTACAFYDRGELVGIKVDGHEDRDLQKVFGWEEGSFVIEARPLAPSLDEELGAAPAEDMLDSDPTIPRLEPRPDETGQHFLRVVEVALATVMQDSESYRPPSRSSPPLSPPSPTRGRPKPVPEPVAGGPPAPMVREDREPTVKIVYHSRTLEPAAEPISVPRFEGSESEERPMANENEGGPAPGSEKDESAAEAPLAHDPYAAGEHHVEEENTTLLGTAAWILVVFALGLFTVRLLAWLPQLK